MEPEGGVMKITLKPVVLQSADMIFYNDLQPGSFLQLSIRDTGIGIEPENIRRIFEPFFTTKDVGKGTGMGLAVVHGIVKSLKGDIKVYSEPGRGTVFHVLLPILRDTLAVSTAVAIEPPRGHGSVLLVDDEPALMDVGANILRSLGYHVTAMRSPLEAFEKFAVDPSAFDLVFTDQSMPGLSGFELARRVLALRPGIPVILCTGYSDLVTEEAALAAGIKAFVTKPLSRLEIAETMQKVMGDIQPA
jgi:CheY-like chemotaxis protein